MNGTSGKQMKRLLELFADLPPDRMQQVLESGLLTAVRDGDLSRVGRVRSSLAHVIDLDTPTFGGRASRGWKVFGEDQFPVLSRLRSTSSSWTYNPASIRLHIFESQMEGRCTLEVLKKESEKADPRIARFAPSALLDFYLQNKHLIPSSWKGMGVLFVGTIYRTGNEKGFGAYQYVRYLTQTGGEWADEDWCSNWNGKDNLIDNGFHFATL